MRLKIYFKIIFLASFLAIFFFGNVYAVKCAPGVTPLPCPSGTTCAACEPEALPKLEEIVVQLIGLIWGLSGIAFTGIFIYNAYLYMFNKIEDAKKRMVQWLIGLLLILFSQPIVATVMKTMIPSGNTCYDSLRQTSFTFFFPQVCTEPTTPAACPGPGYPCWPGP
jgi:hypothetical protein